MTVILRGVSNKHCLLSLFSFTLFLFFYIIYVLLYCYTLNVLLFYMNHINKAISNMGIFIHNHEHFSWKFYCLYLNFDGIILILITVPKHAFLVVRFQYLIVNIILLVNDSCPVLHISIREKIDHRNFWDPIPTNIQVCLPSGPCIRLGSVVENQSLYEQRHGKTCLRGFRNTQAVQPQKLA